MRHVLDSLRPRDMIRAIARGNPQKMYPDCRAPGSRTSLAAENPAPAARASLRPGQCHYIGMAS
jgi:hypothetical protein